MSAELDCDFDSGFFCGQTALKNADKALGIESDAVASFEPRASHYNICVDRVTGHPDDTFYISAREARVLAATLLRAADEADAHDASVPEEKPT